MQIKRKCKSCGKNFIATKEKQWHCSRVCFKKAYFIRHKEVKGIFPIFSCEVCGTKTELRIDPISKEGEFFWTNFKCPNCFPESRKKLCLIVTKKGLLVAF